MEAVVIDSLTEWNYLHYTYTVVGFHVLSSQKLILPVYMRGHPSSLQLDG
jgi:hypothetical protein